MGLDVYLYRYENREETAELEAKYERQSEANWHFNGRPYESLSDAEKDDARKQNEDFAVSLGLTKNGSDPRKHRIELPHEKYPDHYFKVGYFRSSYNGGGINRVLSNLDLPGLYEIFNRKDDDDYVFRPDWELALVNVNDVIERLKQKPNIRCFDVSWNHFKNPNECEVRSQEEAVKVFLDEAARHHDYEGYSNINGHFYHKEPLKVFGLVQGVRKMLFNNVCLPCVYVIMEGENEWYIQALEIVRDTIKYVTEQPDKDKYFLHWSS